MKGLKISSFHFRSSNLNNLYRPNLCNYCTHHKNLNKSSSIHYHDSLIISNKFNKLFKIIEQRDRLYSNIASNDDLNFQKKYEFNNNKHSQEIEENILKKNNSRKVVTRFAPSPTGFLHLGSVRTALFNYLHAKHYNGKFILRIEDTDQNRLVSGAIEHIQQTLKWLNLEYDEFYIQSKRKERYQEIADQLVREGNAYHCFCSKERLEQFKTEKYDRKCMHLTNEEKQNLLQQGINPTIRLIMPREGILKISDQVYGDIDFDYDLYDDCIIMKSDGMPTYHLANVVDDHDMGVTHCIRGMEWLSSIPRHVQLYDSLKWEKPVWMHLPLLYTDEGVKLSKRHGHSNIDWYKQIGYLPEALLNFLMFHGWMHHHNAGKEILSLSEMVSLYNEIHLKNKSKMLNIPTLDDINSQHVQKLIESNIDYVVDFVLQDVKKLNPNVDIEYLKNVLNLAKDRIHVLNRFTERFSYYFEDSLHPAESFTQSLHKTIDKATQLKILEFIIFKLEQLNQPTTEQIQDSINLAKSELGLNFKSIMTVLRYYITGTNVGPHLKDTIYTLGIQKSLDRLKHGRNQLLSSEN